MRKKNYLLFLILFICLIITSKTFARNKVFQDKFILDNELKFDDKELITKENTKEWIKAMNTVIKNYERKIIIKKDFLKLIKRFPSDKNINSAEIIKDIKKYSEILYGHYGLIEMVNELNNIYKFLNPDEYFDIYIITYNFKNLNSENSDTETYRWFALCSINPNHDKELISIRKNLIEVFYSLKNNGYQFQFHENSIRGIKKSGLSKSKLNKIACNEFKKQKEIYK